MRRKRAEKGREEGGPPEHLAPLSRGLSVNEKGKEEGFLRALGVLISNAEEDRSPRHHFFYITAGKGRG